MARMKHNLLIKYRKKCIQIKFLQPGNPARSAWSVMAESPNRRVYFNNIIISDEDVAHEQPQIVASLFNKFFI